VPGARAMVSLGAGAVSQIRAGLHKGSRWAHGTHVDPDGAVGGQEHLHGFTRLPAAAGFDGEHAQVGSTSRSAWARAAESEERPPFRTALRRMLATSTGMRCGAARGSARTSSSAGETWRTPSAAGMVARRNVGTALSPTPDEPVACGRTTPDRARMRSDLAPAGGDELPPLRDQLLDDFDARAVPMGSGEPVVARQEGHAQRFRERDVRCVVSRHRVA